MTERYTWGGDGRDRMDFTIPDLGEANEAVIDAIRATWSNVKAGLHELYVATLDRTARRAHRRRCNYCRSVPGYPKPLRVNGADYQRRRNNRRKRT